MNSLRALRTVGWIASGVALLGGSLFAGFLSALVRQRRLESRDRKTISTDGPPTVGRIEELARAVAQLEKRLDTNGVASCLNLVLERVEKLERCVEQLAGEMPSLPPIDQVLAAVEQMVAAKISGLDERLGDQVQAIELLRNATAQTDLLLQKLIQAVEELADQAGDRRSGSPSQTTGPSVSGGHPGDRDYPVA